MLPVSLFWVSSKIHSIVIYFLKEIRCNYIIYWAYRTGAGCGLLTSPPNRAPIALRYPSPYWVTNSSSYKLQVENGITVLNSYFWIFSVFLEFCLVIFSQTRGRSFCAPHSSGGRAFGPYPEGRRFKPVWGGFFFPPSLLVSPSS